MAAITNALSSIRWQNFLDVDDDVKPWLRIKVADTTFDAVLTRLTGMACSMIQRKIGRPIAPTSFDWRFDGWSGWNGAYQMLPYSPVLEIVSVVEYWGISGPHVLVESVPTAQVDGWQCEYQVGRLTRVFPGNVQKPWFPGSANIEVKWVAGFNPIPDDMMVAALQLVNHWFDNTAQRTAGRPPANNDEATQGAMYGMPPEVISLLEPMMQVGIG